MNVVFDLDGTLVDSAPDIQSVAAAVLKQWERPPLSLAETRQFIGEGAAVFVERMLDARGIAVTKEGKAEVLQAFYRRYADAVEQTVCYPGVTAMLAQCQSSGYHLGLCTNKPEKPTLAVLEHVNIRTYFSSIVCGDTLPQRKPDPAMLQSAIAGLPEGPTLYVGDSETDAQTALAAGIPFALYTEGYRKSEVCDMHWDWRFSEYEELVGIAANMAGSRQ